MRALDFWGSSGKVDIIVPYSACREPRWSRGNRPSATSAASATRGFASRSTSTARRRSLWPSTPPTSRTRHRRQRAGDAPWGQYDPSRAVNLGTNRWSIKPDIGFSKAFAPFTVDLTAGVTLFSRNDDYFGGQAVDQAPLYSTQANLSYDFGRRHLGVARRDLLPGRTHDSQRRAQGQRPEQLARSD